MKKLFYFLFLISFVLTSCENVNDSMEKQTKTVLTPEQHKMRLALELTTNIMLDMIADDRTYFDKLNKVIVAGSPDYLEDRVMMKDLFNTHPAGNTLRVKAYSNQFTEDFKSAFGSNKALKVSGVSGLNTNIFSNYY